MPRMVRITAANASTFYGGIRQKALRLYSLLCREQGYRRFLMPWLG